MAGKAYLVGAGPGDPELITVKGLRCLQQADIILYDRLVNKEILQHAKTGAKLLYCGKKPNAHTVEQEAINEMLVTYARNGYQVVRLKGGDPFVFGRGGEEALHCLKNGIPFEVIPGITSGIAVPAYAGIPVTHRALSRSFAFITGHQIGDIQAKQEWRHLVNGVDTLCIYMGISQLSTIIENVIAGGKAPNTPIAVIQWGTYSEQKIVTSTLTSIVETIEKENITNPSMIIIGEVVSLHKQLHWFEHEMEYTLTAAKG